MLDHGHSRAERYPLGVLWSEKEMVSRRVNRETASNLTMTELMTATAFHGGNKNHGLFKRLLKTLTGK